MCLILLAYRSHPDYPIILAANRDEYYTRPTLPAAFWPDASKVLAGRDLLGGGTWLGITKGGRVSAVTNFRETVAHKQNAPSRGLLVSNFLRGQDAPADYLQQVARNADQYNGFNLIVGEIDQIYYYSNRADKIQKLSPGIYGLSNHLLDMPWPKIQCGKQYLSEIISEDELSPQSIFKILADHTQAADQDLPTTGVGIELERVLSPLFISSPSYGTRSSTILFIDKDGKATFVERTFRPHSDQWEEVKFEFRIHPEHGVADHLGEIRE